MKLFVSKKIQVATSQIHGLGVFAISDISEGELIEECPFLELPIPNGEASSLLEMHRFNYPSGQMTERTKQVVVLGNGSLYNHSNDNNAYWVSDETRETFKFYAKRYIREGEEIFTYYGDIDYWRDGRMKVVENLK